MLVLTVSFVVLIAIENVKSARNEKLSAEEFLESKNFKNIIAKELLKKKLLNLETARQQESLVQFLKNGGSNFSSVKGKTNFYSDDNPSRKQIQMANSFIASSNLLFGTKSQRKATNSSKFANKEAILDVQTLRRSYSGYNEDGNEVSGSKNVFSVLKGKCSKHKRDAQYPISCYLKEPKKLTCVHKNIIYKIQLPRSEVEDNEIGRIVESIYKAVEVTGATERATSNVPTMKKRASDNYLKSLLENKLLLPANTALPAPYNGNAVYIPLIVPVGQDVRAPSPQLPYYSGFLVPNNSSRSALYSNNPLSRLVDAYSRYIFPENSLTQPSYVKQGSDNSTEEMRQNWLALMATNGYVPQDRSMNFKIITENDGEGESQEDELLTAGKGDTFNVVDGKRHSRDTYAFWKQSKRKRENENQYIMGENSNPRALSPKFPPPCPSTMCGTACPTRITTKCTTKRRCPSSCSSSCPMVLQCPHWLNPPSILVDRKLIRRKVFKTLKNEPGCIEPHRTVAHSTRQKVAKEGGQMNREYYSAETFDLKPLEIHPRILASTNGTIQNKSMFSNRNPPSKSSFFARLKQKFHKDMSNAVRYKDRSLGNVRRQEGDTVQYHQPNTIPPKIQPWTLTASPLKMPSVAVMPTTNVQQQPQSAGVYIPQPIGPVGVPPTSAQPPTLHPTFQKTTHQKSLLSFTLQQFMSSLLVPVVQQQPYDAKPQFSTSQLAHIQLLNPYGTPKLPIRQGFESQPAGTTSQRTWRLKDEQPGIFRESEPFHDPSTPKPLCLAIHSASSKKPPRLTGCIAATTASLLSPVDVRSGRVVNGCIQRWAQSTVPLEQGLTKTDSNDQSQEPPKMADIPNPNLFADSSNRLYGPNSLEYQTKPSLQSDEKEYLRRVSNMRRMEDRPHSGDYKGVPPSYRMENHLRLANNMDRAEPSCHPKSKASIYKEREKL